jgi:hypothetical protein
VNDLVGANGRQHREQFGHQRFEILQPITLRMEYYDGNDGFFIPLLKCEISIHRHEDIEVACQEGEQFTVRATCPPGLWNRPDMMAGNQFGEGARKAFVKENSQ